MFVYTHRCLTTTFSDGKVELITNALPFLHSTSQRNESLRNMTRETNIWGGGEPSLSGNRENHVTDSKTLFVSSYQLEASHFDREIKFFILEFLKCQSNNKKTALTFDYKSKNIWNFLYEYYN